MHTTHYRLAIVFVSLVVVALFASVVAASVPLSAGRVILGAAGLAFALAVARLAHAVVTGAPASRRRASRALIGAAAIPAIVLTPTALEGDADIRSRILLASLVWAGLAAAFTAIVVAAEGRGHAGSAVGGGRSSLRHRHAHG